MRSGLLSLLFILSISSCLSDAISQYPPCYNEDITWTSEDMLDSIIGVGSLYDCQNICLESGSCSHFTWYNDEASPINLMCFLFSNPSSPSSCIHCVSGPASCPGESTTANPGGCSIPPPPVHGEWFCLPNARGATCHLECDPGFVSSNRTMNHCSDGVWTFPPDSMICITPVALITGYCPWCGPVRQDGSSVEVQDEPGSSVEVYGTGISMMLPSLPQTRSLHSLNYVDSSVILCGGSDKYGGTTYSSSCLQMTVSQQWVSHSTTTADREGHSSQPMLGRLHLMGGFDSVTQWAVTSTEYLTPSLGSTWEPGEELLVETYLACSAKVSPDMYITTGGFYHKFHVISYNITSGVSSRLQDLLQPRSYHGCALVMDPDTRERGILVAGGYDYPPGTLSHSEMYDLSSGQWTRVGDLQTARDGLKVVVLGDRILAMGGSSSYPDYIYYSTVEEFNINTQAWSFTSSMIEPRVEHAVTAVPHSLVGL